MCSLYFKIIFSVSLFCFLYNDTAFAQFSSQHVLQQYYYQLKGIDKEWQHAETPGEVEFANLSPGDYTLLLKGENSNGVSAGKILKLQFGIQVPIIIHRKERLIIEGWNL